MFLYGTIMLEKDIFSSLKKSLLVLIFDVKERGDLRSPLSCGANLDKICECK